jgi:alpha-D-xyloside xylohydrolase
MGPKMEWTSEKPTDPIELRVYPGADGDFTLYEDGNDGYAYQRGEYATIALHWDDRARALTLSPREGSFPQMLAEHKFRLIIVGPDHGVGIGETVVADAAVLYQGTRLVVKP